MTQDVPAFSDKGNDNFIRTGAIPSSGVTATSSSVGTGSLLTFTITTTPARPSLSVWNFLITIRVDTDDAAHEWPSGASLSAAQLSLRMSQFIDWANSNDTRNIRKHKIVIENFSGGNRTYYLKFKAYTLAYVTGSQA